MENITDEQRAAIKRIDSEPDKTPPKDRLKLMRGALSVPRHAVEESLAKKEKGKRGRPPKPASDPSDKASS